MVATAVATAMDQSGAGKLIAETVVGIMGGHPSPLVVTGVLFALSAVYVWGPFHSPHKPKLRSQGYTGTHIDTGRSGACVRS